MENHRIERRFARRRAWVVPVVKLCIISTAFLTAFLLRFDLQIPAANFTVFLALLLPLLAIKYTAFHFMRMNQGWWRYVSLSDVFVILKANVVASLAFLLYVVFIHGLAGVSRSVLILDGVLCFLFVCGTRFVTRAFREQYFPMFSRNRKDLNRTLIFGAGNAGQSIVREIRQNQSLNNVLIGFVDDDKHKIGKRFQGLKVLSSREILEEILELHNIDELIIAIPSAAGRDMRDIVEICLEQGVKVKTLPSVGELIDGTVSVSHIRDVDLEDLLGREEIKLDKESIDRYLKGKRIVVTGAAGSIGSELCRQIARFGPAELMTFDNAESPLFLLDRELSDRFPDLQHLPVIGDCRDGARVKMIFQAFKPQVVFHAAAYKHVPLMEANPAEAANNNVRGTMIVADTAHAMKVENFVMVSTDKAVNPTNIMGATKRTAELYVQGLSAKSDCHFVTVRFGNVLGSAGSVIPIFKEQVANGGPVTVTHPDVTRFFMTIPEASQLVLQAGSMGQGGEIFLLDMGEPVKIYDLAKELIRLSGFEPEKDIKIEFTGLRPGEKLYEELLIQGEGIVPTSHKQICVAKANTVAWEFLCPQLENLYQASRTYDLESVKTLLREIVPEYQPVNHPKLSPVSDEAKVVPIR